MKETALPSTNRMRSVGVMDVEEALQRLGHDEELFKDILLIYTEDAPAMLRSLHEAVDRADAPALQRAAHSLKGLTANLSAREVASAAFRLEQMGSTGNMSESAAGAAEVDQKVAELDVAVHQYLGRH